MNDNDADIKRLMDYLDASMSPQERAAFEEQLTTDAALRTELCNLQNARDAVNRYGLKQKVAAIHSQMISHTATPQGLLRTITRNSLRIAAAAVLVLGIISIYQYINLTPHSLYKNLYEPYLVSENRGSSDSSNLAKTYHENRFSETIKIFKSLSQPGSEDYFLAGNAYLKSDSAEAAIHCFQSLLAHNQQSGSHRFGDDGEYYLALSYLLHGDVNDALPLFKKIHTDKNHPDHDKVSTWSLRKLDWLRSKD